MRPTPVSRAGRTVVSRKNVTTNLNIEANIWPVTVCYRGYTYKSYFQFQKVQCVPKVPMHPQDV